MSEHGLKLIDIGANLLDPMFTGEYNGKQYHAPDLEAVLERSWAAGIEKIIITAGNLMEAKAALQMANFNAGVHPTRCGELENHAGGPNAYLEELLAVIKSGAAAGKVVAVGECGLDYDRLHFCDAETQRRGFEAQFALAEASQLPMFLHLRAACPDFVEILRRNRGRFPAAVVHSFDGTRQELQSLLTTENTYVGLNGCSLKTEANLDVSAAVPLDRLMLETDCPWCEVRASHAGRRYVRELPGALPPGRDKKKHDPAMCVKGRCEPVHLLHVLQVVAGHRGVPEEQVAAQVFETSMRVFFPSKP